MLYSHIHGHQQHHNDTIMKTQEDFFIKYCTSHFIARVRKGYSRFACERELETEQNWNILTPNLWPATLYFFRPPDAQPEALGSTLLDAGFLYCILSATSLVLKLHRGSRGPPRPGVAFPTTSLSNWLWNSTGPWLPSWLRYIIVHAHSIAHSIFEIECLIVIKRKYLSFSS